MSKKTLPATSLAANKAATAEMRSDHHAKIIKGLRVLGSATYEELANHLGMDRHQIGRRLSELERELIVFKPGNTKPTKSGRSAYVYCLTNGASPKTENEIKYLKQEKASTDYAKNILDAAKNLKQESLF